MHRDRKLTWRRAAIGALLCIVFPLVVSSTWWAGNVSAEEITHGRP